jgi:hypothetical protein
MKVRESVASFGAYDWDGGIDDIIVMFTDLKETYSDQELKVSADYEQDYDDERVFRMEVYYDRGETQEERIAREKKEEEAKQQSLHWKRRQLEALKKELGE